MEAGRVEEVPRVHTDLGRETSGWSLQAKEQGAGAGYAVTAVCSPYDMEAWLAREGANPHSVKLYLANVAAVLTIQMSLACGC